MFHSIIRIYDNYFHQEWNCKIDNYYIKVRNLPNKEIVVQMFYQFIQDMNKLKLHLINKYKFLSLFSFQPEKIHETIQFNHLFNIDKYHNINITVRNKDLSLNNHLYPINIYGIYLMSNIISSNNFKLYFNLIMKEAIKLHLVSSHQIISKSS